MGLDFQVLIIDEDRELCRALSAKLFRTGYRVECLSGPANPLPVIKDLGPDAIILDICMPETRGLEILRRLETDRNARKIPIIVTTRQVDLEYELLDVFDFLPKPLDEERLLEDLAILSQKTERLGVDRSLNREELALFQEFLVNHSGLHFDHRNIKILERGLLRRMRAVHARNYRDYFYYLETYQESRRELKKLLNLLTIGETYFFRYLAHFEALAAKVIPELIERNRREKTLRIWSAGCSSGEEPYSVAMLLLERFPELADWQLHILGTDINKRALRRAREGVYGPRSLRVTEERYRDRYFQRLGKSSVLDPRVRNMVQLSYLNLQTGTFPATENGTAGVDILLCRNVLIYFRLATIRRIIAKFAECLRPGGYLFLGHAETLMNISERFQRVQAEGGFIYRLKSGDAESAKPPGQPPGPTLRPASKPPAPAPAKTSPPPSPTPAPEPEKASPARSSPPPEGPGPDPEELFREAVQAFNREDYRTASQSYDTILRHLPEHVGALVGRGFILANQGRYEEALDYGRRALEIDDLCAEAYFLNGLILELKDEAEAAVTEYRKALLLDMDFIMPHYNLGKIFWRTGRKRDALRELHNTVRLLERAPDEAQIPFSGGLSRAVFLEVCREDFGRMRESKAGGEY